MSFLCPDTEICYTVIAVLDTTISKEAPPRSSRGMTVNGVLTRHTLELYYQVYSFCTQNILLLYAQNNLFVRRIFCFCTLRIIFLYAKHFAIVRSGLSFSTLSILLLYAEHFVFVRST